MIEKALIKGEQFKELVKEKGLMKTLVFSLYSKKEAVPVVKDISNINIEKNDILNSNQKIIELTRYNNAINNIKYNTKSRQLKVSSYIKQGYKGFILVEDNEVVSDVWCFDKKDRYVKHDDLKLFNINIEDKLDVYLFDLFVEPSKRKNAKTNIFMKNVLSTLNKNGYKRAYGYYMKDNVPALWLHKTLGYKDISTYIFKRYFLFRYVIKING